MSIAPIHNPSPESAIASVIGVSRPKATASAVVSVLCPASRLRLGASASA
jgi:hypothetical protein